MQVPVEEVRKLAEGILIANGVPADHAAHPGRPVPGSGDAGDPQPWPAAPAPGGGAHPFRRHGARRHRRPGMDGAQLPQHRWPARPGPGGRHGGAGHHHPARPRKRHRHRRHPQRQSPGRAGLLCRACRQPGPDLHRADGVRSAGASLGRAQGDDRHQSHRHRRAGRSPHPMVLDMATGLVSMGKIHDHANRNAPIPLGWALDENGDPTTDAAAAKKGAIAPFGGPKGYALGLAFEVLVSSLAGVGHRHRRQRHAGFGEPLQQGRPVHRHRAAACRCGARTGQRLSGRHSRRRARRSRPSGAGARRPRPEGARPIAGAGHVSRRRPVGRPAEAGGGIQRKETA